VATEGEIGGHRVDNGADRFDNDVVPALNAGLKPVMLRRGVWGYLQAGEAQELGVPVIDSLAELLDMLA
jgi:FMN phosphatase YigB (HAD superfamily)